LVLWLRRAQGILPLLWRPAPLGAGWGENQKLNKEGFCLASVFVCAAAQAAQAFVGLRKLCCLFWFGVYRL